MKSTILITTLAALSITTSVTRAAVGFIYHDSATTNGGVFNTSFPLSNLKNAGKTSHLDTENANDNSESYATTNPPAGGFPVTITLDFTNAVDLTDFYLWNHSNNGGAGAPSAGIADFTLTFYDGASGGGSQIGGVFSGTALAAPATGTYAAQIFDFGTTYSDVRSVELEIANRISGTGFVAIRELGFEVIPEPGSALLLGLGSLALVRRRR